MQKCWVCGDIKPINEFYKNKSKLLKIGSECKICKIKLDADYRHTKTGLIFQIYSKQKQNSIKRGHSAPNYTKEQLLAYVLNLKEFEFLYKYWVNSKFKKDLTPSLDRKDVTKPYKFDNIDLVPWWINDECEHTARKIGLRSKFYKSVISIDLNTKEEIKYFSMSEASRITGIKRANILKAIKGQYSRAGNFKWRYK